VIEIDTVTHRRDPIYYTIIPAEMEHLLLGALPREATIPAHQQRTFLGVMDAHLALGGVCRYHLYVKLKKKCEGEPKNVIIGAFSSHCDIKQVVVDDDDVDVHNPTEVEWAPATRFQADRDLVVISSAHGSMLDPSTTLNNRPGDEYQGVSASMALDATKPAVYDEHVFTRVRIPGEDEVDLKSEVDAGARPDWAKILAE
jgi:2,5-furandicarboxylate decarboxylase 1